MRNEGNLTRLSYKDIISFILSHLSIKHSQVLC